MLSILGILACGTLFRLDGVGAGDNFLPGVKLFRQGGINYARYGIAAFAFASTLDPWHAAAYALAASIPYGEKHWWMKGGLVSWFLIGALWGGASLNWGMAVWLGVAVVIAKLCDLDQAWLEFGVLGCGSMLWTAFK